MVSLSFFVGHRSGRNRVPSAVRELNHNAKQMPSGCGLPQHIIDGILPLGSCTLDQRPAEASFFDFSGGNTVACYMVDSVFRLDELMNLHSCHYTKKPVVCQ